ncbi:MAG: TIGR04211 family SH3 domain-containing protein [Woeseia sp.]
MRTIIISGSCLLAAAAVQAEPAWVSDQFEAMLRTGPTTEHAITRMVQSGTQVEVLERDRETGYARVRTGGGTEGWVLTRYLMNEPSAREQLERLTGQLTNATTRGSTLTSQLDAIKGQYDNATTSIAALERDKQALQTELDDIKQTASNTLAIDRQNKDLRQQLTDAEIKVSILEQENQALSGQTTRNWFLAGALVLIVGIVLGLWLPRIRWQKRSRYERF